MPNRIQNRFGIGGFLCQEASGVYVGIAMFDHVLLVRTVYMDKASDLFRAAFAHGECVRILFVRTRGSILHYRRGRT